MENTHSDMKRCDDCGRRVSSIVTGFWSRELGQVVGEHEQVCTTCLEARQSMAERQLPLFAEVANG